MRQTPLQQTERARETARAELLARTAAAAARYPNGEAAERARAGFAAYPPAARARAGLFPPAAYPPAARADLFPPAAAVYRYPYGEAAAAPAAYPSFNADTARYSSAAAASPAAYPSFNAATASYDPVAAARAARSDRYHQSHRGYAIDLDDDELATPPIIVGDAAYYDEAQWFRDMLPHPGGAEAPAPVVFDREALRAQAIAAARATRDAQRAASAARTAAAAAAADAARAQAARDGVAPPNCRSYGIDPNNTCNKADYRRQARLFHPDGNAGCLDQSTPKFRQLDTYYKACPGVGGNTRRKSKRKGSRKSRR